MDRLNFFSQATTDAVTDQSAEQRTLVAGLTFDAILGNPIVGHAVAPVVNFGDAAHNQILEYWYTFGIFGLLFVLWTLYLLNKQASNKIFFGLVSAEALFFLWFGLFNHTLYNFNFWMIFFAASLVVNQQSSTISFAQEPELPSKKSRRKRKSRRRRSSRSSRWEPSHSSKKHREG